MSFRKRNVGLVPASNLGSHDQASDASHKVLTMPGTRPSPLDGRSTTSTGATSLDSLFSGHAGLPLGCSLLVEENGTTDYAGTLLRYYAAEGLLQGHTVVAMGVPEQWGRDLPGVVVSTEPKEDHEAADDKMKIAWRYERLGQQGGISKSREPQHSTPTSMNASPPITASIFCHTFDLTKRLEHPADSSLVAIPIDDNPKSSPFDAAIDRLKSMLRTSSPTSVFRIVIPSLLSPALYPPTASNPTQILAFLQVIRSLLAQYSSRLSIIITLPLSLHPRSLGLVRCIERLCDGVIELTPFPHSSDAEPPKSSPGSNPEEPPQGLLRVHKLPICHDRGSGTSHADEDWAFNLSRRKLTIKPYSLPPMEGDTEAQQTNDGEKKAKKGNMEF